MNTIPFEKSFASNEKSKYWSDKNELKPEQVYNVSAKKYYFDCDKCNHEFINNPSHIKGGRWCPYCCIPQKKLCGSKDCTDCFEKSFASHEKSVFWSDKNEQKPDFILKKGDKKIWFNCDKCNHDFETQIKAVTISNHWCPYCVNQKLCDNNECKECFNKSFASHEKAKFWSSKNSISPRQIFKGSGKKYWFDCDKCCHEFYMSLTHISGRNSWCPYCSNKQMCDNDDCKECFNKSFASHIKANFWSVKNKETQRQTFKFNNNKFWFNCDKCSHDFETSLNSWCPYCDSVKMCDNDNCKDCFNKSFASHIKAKFWSSKNKDDPRHLFQGTAEKYWFNCDKCDHDFEKSLNDITGSKNGWCPYCANKKMCYEQPCKDCFNKSFASHEKVKCWSSKNKDDPRHLFQGNNNKYWFNCDKCNLDFETPLISVKSGYWCPYCVNKTETKIYKILKEKYPTIIHQFKVEWCKNITYLPFDFCIPEYKIIIELDGPQHFIQIMEWKTPEEQLIRDIYKRNCANENGFSIIRLLQPDVLFDKYDWLYELTTNIDKIISEGKVQNIYMCKNNEYKDFDNEIN